MAVPASPVLPPPADDPPVVAVYRSWILNYNEPYIRTQAEAVPGYRSVYVGTRRVPNATPLPPERTIVLRDAFARADRLFDGVVRRLPLPARLRALAAAAAPGRVGETAFLLTGAAPGLVRRVRARRPALVHAHLGIDGAQALPLARRLGVPLVVTFHGFDATVSDEKMRAQPTRGRVFLRRRAALQREAARVVAVSGFIRDSLVARGWPAERVVVHYMGVDTAAFRPDPAAAPLAERAPVIFFAGRLIEKKGLRYLIDAMPAVQARVPGAEVVIAGTGPLRASLEARAAAAGARVRFLGRVSPEEVRGWLGRAQLFCMPSVRAADGDGEGLPTVVVEAMACGVPVVGTRHAGIPEAVVDGETGLLADEGDVGALAEHLVAVLGDAALRTRMGAASRARVVEHFDTRRQAAALARIYDAVRAEYARR